VFIILYFIILYFIILNCILCIVLYFIILYRFVSTYVTLTLTMQQFCYFNVILIDYSIHMLHLYPLTV